MTKIQASATIDRPVDEVWKFITCVSNGPKWDNIRDGTPLYYEEVEVAASHCPSSVDRS